MPTPEEDTRKERFDVVPTDKSETGLSIAVELVSSLRRSPVLTLLVLSVYISGGAVLFLYQRQKYQALELRERDLVVQTELRRALAVEKEKSPFGRSPNESFALFKQLSFNEITDSHDSGKLQVALGLNSYARDALSNYDFDKARGILDKSVKTIPTLEAQYYLGVLEYLEGNNEGALKAWKPLAGRKGVPSDIYLFLALAQYRAGDIAATKHSAALFSEAHQPETDPTFETNLAPIWSDPDSQLAWITEDNGQNFNWPDADRFCRTLKAGGHVGWRLPSIDELATLYNPGQTTSYVYRGSAYNTLRDGFTYYYHLREDIRLHSCCAWSSTKDPNQSANAFYYRFQSGEKISFAMEESGAMRALCVH